MIKWKDETSYSQHDKERVPRTWTTKIGKFDLIVTRIVHYSDTWFWRSRSLGIDDARELRSKDIDYAKHEAILQLKLLLHTKADEISEAMQILDDYKHERTEHPELLEGESK